jgi:hypothetical protein
LARLRALSIRAAPAAVAEVAADDLEVLEAVIAEPFLASDIGAVPLAVLVVGSVVLTDEAGHGIEQVRYAEQPAVEIEDSWLQSGGGRPASNNQHRRISVSCGDRLWSMACRSAVRTNGTPSTPGASPT